MSVAVAVRRRAHSISLQISKHQADDFFTTFSADNWPSLRADLCRLVVLDSSFNPPTKAHSALLTTSIAHFQPDYFDASLLLFSMRNVDKQLTGATLLQRAQMMEIVAHGLQSEKSKALQTIAVGLTPHGRFIDKAVHIDRWFQQQWPGRKLEMHFILGYDTVTRLLNPTYYSVPLQAALDPFFDRCRLICADRAGFDQGQVDEFWAGPVRIYKDKVKRICLDNSLATLSSTAARIAAKKCKDLDNIVEEDIAQFIREEQIYL